MRPAPPVRPLAPLLAALCLAGALAGCRPGTALHGRFNNFRAYYNTYYNAERALEQGEAALERQAVTVDRNRLVAVFPETAAAQTGGPFQEAIDKSAELLRNRPTSAWADDALLLIGKAYFYQRNVVGAEQKFREAIAAAALVEDRRLGDEARFWLGRTYAAGDRFEEGVAVLEEGLVDDEGDRRWTARMRLALGELYARAGRWDQAAEALRAGAPEESDADIGARAYVLLAQVEEHAERWDQAAQAYAEALDRKPAYELAYAAEVGRALVLGREAGRSAEGLEILRRMRSDDKHYERRGELALIEARLRTAAGEDERALRLYRAVLYDETFSGGIVRGEAHYRLGEFYRDAQGDYVRAAAHFDTAATALRAPTTDIRPARGALLGVADEAQTYNALAGAAGRLAEADSLLALGALPEEAFRARIAAIEAERRRVYRDQQQRLAAARTEQEFRGGGVVTLQDTPGQPQTPATAAGSREGGFLSYRLPASLQAGKLAFEQTWRDRPLVPNWRRSAAIQAGDVAAAQGVVGDEIDGGFGIGDGPPPLDLTAVPRTPEKRSELITELAGLRYELANAFFLSLGRADTAAALYRSILADTPDLAVATRARYALAEIERSAGRDEAARPLYEAVAAADSAALGRASRVRLGLESEGADVPAPLPSTAAFDAARQRWQGGAPLEAAADLVALGDADPGADIAPRAYVAAAAAYVDAVGADSVALARPMPARLVSPVLLAIADSAAAAEIEAAAAQAVAAAPAGPPVLPAAADTLSADDRLEAEGNPAPFGLDAEATPDEPADAAPVEPVPAQPMPADAAPVEPVPAQPMPVDAAPVPPAQVLDGGKEIPGRPSPRPADASPRPVAPAPLQAAPAAAPPRGRPGSVAGLVGGLPAGPRAAAGGAPSAPTGPLARADSASFTLRHHLRAVAIRYPASPLAARARQLVETLPAPPPVDLRPYLPVPDTSAAPIAADSTRAPVPDSTGPLPPLAPADSTAPPPVLVDDAPAPPLGEEGEEERVFLAEGEAPAPAAEAVDPDFDPAEVPGLRGPEPVDPAGGGFTWRVRTISIPEEGTQTVEILREAGFRVGLLQEAATGAYIIGIGQFETAERAESAGPGVPAWARLRGDVVDLTAYQPDEAGDGAP